MGNESQYRGLRQHSKESNDFAKECLKTATLELSKTKDYKDISITELCRKAGVSRMAFYRNYDVVNDIFHEIASDLNDEVVRTIGSPFRMRTSKDWYVKVFELVARHKDTMSLMFEENFQFEWMKIVNGFAVHDDSFSSEKKYQRLMWSGGFENTLSYWLKGGLKESPEEMAEYCIKYLPHLMTEQL